MLIFVFIAGILVLFVGAVFLLDKNCGLNGLLKYPVAFALIISLLSYTYYLTLLFQIDYRLLLAGIILVPGLYISALLYRKKKLISSAHPGRSDKWIFTITVLILTIRFNKYVYRWGDWDAWAIWNLHAKFLFYPEYWINMFTSKLAETHPDYPLFLPSLTAFVWRGVGFITPIVPIVIAHLVLIAIPLTVYIALSRYKHSFAAIMVLVIFVLDKKFINLAGSQYADTLVAFFVLMTFVLYEEIKLSINPKLVFILGFIAGSATWIKNEGLLFFLAFSFSYLCFNYRKPLTILTYFAGCLIPLLILIHFKLKLAPANDLIHADRGGEMVGMIKDPARYLLITKHFIVTSFKDYWILLVLFVMILVNKMPFVRTLPFLVIALVLCGYFAVYLTTPHDLDWHLGASLDRLLHHIYPACLYLFLLKFSENRELRIWG